VKRYVVGGDLEVVSAAEARDRPLQSLVFEGDEAAAVVAEQVMVMLAAGLSGLVACDPRTEVEPVDEAQLLELLEGAVDAGAAGEAAAAAELALDLLRADCAGLASEALDHGSPRSALLVAGRGEPGQGQGGQGQGG
jgi:hypothetical protein